MRRKLIVIIAAIAVLSTPAGARPKAVMLVVSSTSLEDLTSPDLPNFRRLVAGGSIGLMNTRTAGTLRGEQSATGLESACLTLGAGTRAVGSSAAREAYDADQKLSDATASDLWAAKTLLTKRKAEVVQPLIARIAADNAGAKHDVAIGALAKALHSSHLKTAVVGNADIQNELHREAAVIAMDETGLVDYGEVGGRLSKRNPASPFGLASDHAAYFRALDRVWPLADLIVVDPGDTLRADMYADRCTAAQGARLRRWAVERTDHMLGNLMKRLDPRKDLLFVLSPNHSHQAEEDGGPLTPVILWGSGVRRGILTSYSTRWPGLVTNADIAPTLLSFFGAAIPASMVGRPVYTIPAPDNLSRITAMQHRLVLRDRQQGIARWVASLDVVIILGVTAALVYTRRRGALLAWLSLLPASAVLAAFCLPLFGSWDLWPSAVGLTVLSSLLALAALRLWSDRFRALALICLALSAGLVLDLVFGSRLLRESVLSYSASGGARYYGLGNEYMGAIIGATVVGMGILFHQWNLEFRRRQFLAVVMLGTAVAAIGAPFLGTNTGGVMSAIPAAIVVLVLRRGREIRPVQMVGIVCTIVAAVGLLILFDSLRSTGQSHIGRFGSALASGGFQQFLLVVERKLAMNLVLFESSVWSRLMMAAGVALTVLWLNAHTGVASTRVKVREVYAALVASVVGGAAAFAFNDSGVVAAAMCLIYPWSAAAMLALRTNVGRSDR